MTSMAREAPSTSSTDLIGRAVYRHRASSMEGALERLFSLAFSRLVYAQIWEDPVIDMEALAIGPDTRIATIASGGCNIMSYLAANPARIDAVDLNGAHIALNRLKLAAARGLPGYPQFLRFFGASNDAANIAAYERHVRPLLDDESRRYWDGRDGLGRRRITRFARGFYRYGLLGRFIGLAHRVARFYGKDPRLLLAGATPQERRRTFEQHFAPLFERSLLKRVLSHRASLFGLGIPPAQFDALGRGHGGTMAEVVRSRLERLACDFDPADNYFAWQAFNRGYGTGERASLPPYLRESLFEAVKSRAGRVAIHHRSLIDYLADQPAHSIDRFVLLDAQDWMNDDTLNALWEQITRTAGREARVIFRTAAEETLLPGRVSPDTLAAWHYEAATARALHARDRSAIYGGFHLYTRIRGDS